MLCGATLIFLFPLAVWIYNSQYMRLVADDYCQAASVRDYGAFKYIFVVYQTWGGRYTATLVYGLLSNIGYTSIWLLIGTLMIAWLLALVWVYAQVAELIHMDNRLLVAVCLGVITLFSVFAASPNMIQSLYWIGSLANYVIPMFCFTLWVGGVLAIWKQETSTQTLTIWTIFSAIVAFVLGGFAETYVVFQTAVCGLAGLAAMIWLRDGRRLKLALPLAAGLAGSVLALVVQISSPGSSIRQGHFPQDTPILERIVDSLEFVPFGYSRLASVVLPGACVLAILIANRSFRANFIPDSRVILRMFALTGIAALILIWAAKFPSYYVMTIHPPYRALLITTAVSVILMVTWGMLVAMLLPHLPSRRRRIWNVIFLSIGVAALIPPLYGGLVALDATTTFRAFAQSWDEQQTEILSERASGNRSVVVPPLPVDMYAMLDLEMIVSQPDSPSYWVNECVAAYYQVDTIQAATTR